MNFARDGYPWMALSAAVAATVLATAVWRRSWSMWLLGFALLLLATWVAWIFRMPAPRTLHTASRDAIGVAASSVHFMTAGMHHPRAMSRGAARAT